MGVKLSSFKEHTRKIGVKLDIFDVEINLGYKPGLFTPEMEDEIENLNERGLLSTMNKVSDLPEDEQAQILAEKIDEQPKVVNYTVELLTRLIAYWDITDDDNKALPVTVETVKKVPYVILRAAMQEIVEDMRPKTKSSKI